jgi:hypothetical protein
MGIFFPGDKAASHAFLKKEKSELNKPTIEVFNIYK